MVTDDELPAILYKYLDAKGGLSMIENEEIWCTRAKNLNDPYDCCNIPFSQSTYSILTITVDVKSLFENIGVCSLTNTSLDFLMWSYYNNHKGICVGLDMTVIKEWLNSHEKGQACTIIKVKYQDDIPSFVLTEIVSQNDMKAPINFTSNEKSQNTINNYLSTKALWWEHENEYRVIVREFIDSNNEPVKLSIKNLINSVYLGCKCGKDTTEKVIMYAKSRNFTVFKLKLKQDMYGLETEVLYNPTTL